MAKYRFQLLDGRHAEGSTTDDLGRKVQKIYRKGDIVDTDKNLAKQFNSPGCIKFRKLADGEQVVETEAGSTLADEYSKMTVADLKALASEEGIDLGNATKKDDIANIIRLAYNGD